MTKTITYRKTISILLIAALIITAVFSFSLFTNDGKSFAATKNVKVTFDPNGGSKVKAKTVAVGSAIGKLTKSKRSGYLFRGWFKGSVKYTKNTKVKKAITLNARWVKKGTGATITKTEIARIKAGMTLKEVRYAIGGRGFVFHDNAQAANYTAYYWIGDTKDNSTGVGFYKGKVIYKVSFGEVKDLI